MGIFLFFWPKLKEAYEMDLKIRDVDIRAVKVLDEEAKTQKISRNELLKRMVEDAATFDGIKLAKKNLDVSTNQVASGLEMTYQRLHDVEKQILKLYFLLCDALGVDPIEKDMILEKTFNINERR